MDGAAIPPWIALAATAFVAVLVPVYWKIYGPTNFLWFSDIALGSTVAALWLESPLLLWMVARLGYDRRAWAFQSLVAVVVFPLSRAVTPPADNVNWVHGPGG